MPRATPSISQNGLPLGDAMCKYGRPLLVAELGRLLDDLQDMPLWISDAESLKVDLERRVEKLRNDLWEDLRKKLAAGELILTWQPLEPTAERQSLPANRCLALIADITIDEVGDRVFLNSYPLDQVLVHPVRDGGDQAPVKPATEQQIDQCIIALDNARPLGSPPLNRDDIRDRVLPMLEAKGLTAKKEAIEDRFESEAHTSRRRGRGRPPKGQT
jgi:hypothetical protein